MKTRFLCDGFAKKNHPYPPPNGDTSFDSLSSCFDEEKEILQDFIGDLCNSCQPEKLRFEFSPRNIRAINGQLILLDCFFSLDALNNTRKAA